MIIINIYSYYSPLNTLFVSRTGLSHAVNGEAEQSLAYFRCRAVLVRSPALHFETEVKATSSAPPPKRGEERYSHLFLVGGFLVSRWP